MKLHYKGKYNGDPTSLPKKEHEENAVMFKEPKSADELAKVANIVAFAVAVVFSIPMYLYFKNFSLLQYLAAGFMMILLLLPHELLHAICFKEDVYLYTYLKQGILFVVGPERMSKRRFIFLSLLPNFVFGLLPYILAFLLNIKFLALVGFLNLTCGCGDYLNVYNALKQMPKKAKCYLYEFNSYWYIPKE